MYLRLTKRMVQFIQETMLKFMVPPMVKAFWMTLYRSNLLSTRGWAAVLKDAQSEKVLLSFKKCAKLLSWALLTHLRRRCSESCFGKFFWGSRQSEKNNVKVNVVQVITIQVMPSNSEHSCTSEAPIGDHIDPEYFIWKMWPKQIENGQLLHNT